MTTPKRPLEPLIVVLGPTGTGKSQLAVDIAARYDGEIINGDAMQMYDGLPVITNKITVEEQQGIPHHLLGVVSLKEEPWRVGLFKKEAGRLIREIRSRGRLPIVVGGTHYYTQSLLFDDALVTESVDYEEVEKDELSRQEINEKFPILNRPIPEMLEKLKEVDPVMAERWHPNDGRKIRRSLEIYLTTGRRASDIYTEQRQQRTTAGDRPSAESDAQKLEISSLFKSSLLFWVHAGNEILKSRLNSRVDKMLEQGLLDEVKTLSEYLQRETAAGTNLDTSSGIWVSIGFKEFEPYISAIGQGSASPEALKAILSESIEQTKASTRRYAKSQIKWIRLKLLPRLSQTNTLDKLYLLDSSDLDRWSEKVSTPALNIIQDFLNGEALPAPAELSPMAHELLDLKRDFDLSDRPDLWVRHVCEVCGSTSVTQDQWESHLSSRGHKARVKRAKRNELKEQYLKENGGHIPYSKPEEDGTNMQNTVNDSASRSEAEPK